MKRKGQDILSYFISKEKSGVSNNGESDPDSDLEANRSDRSVWRRTRQVSPVLQKVDLQ